MPRRRISALAWLLVAGSWVAGSGGCCAFGFGVQFAAEQDGQAAQVGPEDDDDHAGERAVGAGLGDVEGEASRGEQEDARTEQSPWR